MRVLQTLGRHRATNQEGIFQYRRDQKGVFIDLSVGQAGSLSAKAIRISHGGWRGILKAFADKSMTTFRLTAANASGRPPRQSVYTTLKKSGVLPKNTVTGAPVPWRDPYCAAIAAILEHEGSLDLYAGPLGHHKGRVYSTPIHLGRDS
jgi:hypothetical protein